MCSEFQSKFPDIRLHLRSVLLEQVSEYVLQGEFTLGISVVTTGKYSSLVADVVTRVAMINVAAPNHPLTTNDRSLGQEDLEKHLQIVVSNDLATPVNVARNVFGKEIWKVASPTTKKELLLAGIGWGALPEYMIQQELKTGQLRELNIVPHLQKDREGYLYAIRRPETILGKGSRWIWEYLQALES